MAILKSKIKINSSSFKTNSVEMGKQIDVLKSLSLDLINNVEKSDIRDACVFQYKIPKPIQHIYSLLLGTCKTVE